MWDAHTNITSRQSVSRRCIDYLVAGAFHSGPTQVISIMASSLILTLLSNHWELVVIAALTIVVAKLYFRLQRPTSSSSSSDNGTEGEFGDPSPQDVDNVGWEEDTDMVPYRPPRYDPEVMQQRARDFYENMNQRRTCRHFSRQAVDIKVLEEVIRTAGMEGNDTEDRESPWCQLCRQ